MVLFTKAITNVSSREKRGNYYSYIFRVPGNYEMHVSCDSPFERGDVIVIESIENDGVIVSKTYEKPSSNLPVLCFLTTKIPLGEDTDFKIISNEDFTVVCYWRTSFLWNVRYTALGLLYRSTVVLGVDYKNSSRFEWSVSRVDYVV